MNRTLVVALAGLIPLTGACANVSVQGLYGQSVAEAKQAHDVCFSRTYSSWRQTLMPLYLETDEQYGDYEVCMLDRGYRVVYREGMGYHPDFVIQAATAPLPPPPPPPPPLLWPPGPR